jgi:hypothetical protein
VQLAWDRERALAKRGCWEIWNDFDKSPERPFRAIQADFSGPGEGSGAVIRWGGGTFVAPIICTTHFLVPELNTPPQGISERERVMDSILSLPGQGYDYIHGHFGTTGVIFAGVMLVVAIVAVMIWYDRRK